MCEWWKYFRHALRTGTTEIMAHLDTMERKQVKIEREIENIKKRIDPLAELVESLQGQDEKVRYHDR